MLRRAFGKNCRSATPSESATDAPKAAARPKERSLPRYKSRRSAASSNARRQENHGVHAPALPEHTCRPKSEGTPAIAPQSQPAAPEQFRGDSHADKSRLAQSGAPQPRPQKARRSSGLSTEPHPSRSMRDRAATPEPNSATHSTTHHSLTQHSTKNHLTPDHSTDQSTYGPK